MADVQDLTAMLRSINNFASLKKDPSLTWDEDDAAGRAELARLLTLVIPQSESSSEHSGTDSEHMRDENPKRQHAKRSFDELASQSCLTLHQAYAEEAQHYRKLRSTAEKQSIVRNPTPPAQDVMRRDTDRAELVGAVAVSASAHECARRASFYVLSQLQVFSLLCVFARQRKCQKTCQRDTCQRWFLCVCVLFFSNKSMSLRVDRHQRSKALFNVDGTRFTCASSNHLFRQDMAGSASKSGSLP